MVVALDRSDPGADGRRVRRSPIVRVVIAPGPHLFTFKAWGTVSEVKQRLQEATGCRFSWLRLFHGSQELYNTQRLLELLDRRRHPQHSRSPLSSSHHRTLKLTLKVQNPHDLTAAYVTPWGATDPSAIGRAGERLLARIGQGIGLGLAPALALDGMGGTYVFRDAKRRPVAAFKPRDEEPFAPNNPRGLAGKMGQPGIHPAIPSGESHLREVIAYTLDHRGFSAVPPTLQAEALHPAFHVQSLRPLSRYGAKVGSLQAWVSHADLASDVGVYSLPAQEVHKIAILDMRLLNTDRNDGNVLVTRRESPPTSPAAANVGSGGTTPPSLPAGGAEERQSERSSATSATGEDACGSPEGRTCGGGYLVPIDHGGVLPTRAEVVWYNWCWLSWPQMSASLSAEALDYIGRLDPIADARAIVDAGLPPACARVCRCATRTLQRGVASGLGLLDVAHMLARQEEERPSDLERLMGQAERLAHSAMRNHRLRGAGQPPEFASATEADAPCPRYAPFSPVSVRRAVSHGSVTDESAATGAAVTGTATVLAADATAAYGIERPREPAPLPPPPSIALSNGLSRGVMAIQPHSTADDDDDDDDDDVSLHGLRGHRSGRGTPSGPPPTPIAGEEADEPPPSPGLARRMPLRLHRRVASFSTLIGMEEMASASDALVGAGGSMAEGLNAMDALGSEGGRALRSERVSWDDEIALEALFFTYFERLLEDGIKRVATRKRGRAASAEREEQKQQQKLHTQPQQQQEHHQPQQPQPQQQPPPTPPPPLQQPQQPQEQPQQEQLRSPPPPPPDGVGGHRAIATEREQPPEQHPRTWENDVPGDSEPLPPPPASPLLARRLLLSTTRCRWADAVSEADEESEAGDEGRPGLDLEPLAALGC